MEFIKKNFVLLLAFALPILLIIVVALSVYLPSLFISTKYNFIYASCSDESRYAYDCNLYLQKHYQVVEGKFVVTSVDQSAVSGKNGMPNVERKYIDRVFLHDTAKNESREITLEEAQSLKLNSLLTSPDGVTVSSRYSRSSGGLFLFGGGSSSFGYYLTKGRGHSKLNLINSSDTYYYQNNFQFLGWIVPGRN